MRLEWQKVGTNALPSNAVTYDGELVIEDVNESNAGQYRCTATGDHQYATDDATLEVSPPKGYSQLSYFFFACFYRKQSRDITLHHLTVSFATHNCY